MWSKFYFLNVIDPQHLSSSAHKIQGFGVYHGSRIRSGLNIDAWVSGRLIGSGLSNRQSSSVRAKVLCCKSHDHSVGRSRTAKLPESPRKVSWVVTPGQQVSTLCESYPSAEMQSMYSTAPADCAGSLGENTCEKLPELNFTREESTRYLTNGRYKTCHIIYFAIFDDFVTFYWSKILSFGFD